MSESPSESQSESSGSGSGDTPETGLISDDQLPDDLNPEENPLARDPDDDPDGEGGGGAGGAPAGGPGAPGADEEKVEGLPDVGEPGAAG